MYLLGFHARPPAGPFAFHHLFGPQCRFCCTACLKESESFFVHLEDFKNFLAGYRVHSVQRYFRVQDATDHRSHFKHEASFLTALCTSRFFGFRPRFSPPSFFTAPDSLKMKLHSPFSRPSPLLSLLGAFSLSVRLYRCPVLSRCISIWKRCLCHILNWHKSVQSFQKHIVMLSETKQSSLYNGTTFRCDQFHCLSIKAYPFLCRRQDHNVISYTGSLWKLMLNTWSDAHTESGSQLWRMCGHAWVHQCNCMVSMGCILRWTLAVVHGGRHFICNLDDVWSFKI